MKKLTENQEKINLVKRLVDSKEITFEEGISLLTIEVEKEYISYPYYQPIGTWPTYPAITYTGDTVVKYNS